MKESTQHRNAGIDILRAAGCLYIVGFWHLLDYTNAVVHYNNPVTLRLTYIILGTFIFVSGYYVGLRFKTTSRNDIIGFYKKRLIRIYPLYLIAILLFAMLQLSDVRTSLKAAFLISMIVGKSPPTLWFIALLMTYYVISPLIIYAVKALNTFGTILSFALFIACLMILFYITGRPDLRMIVYFPSYLLGIYVADRKIDNTVKGHMILIPVVATIFLSFLEFQYVFLEITTKTIMILLCSFLVFRTGYNIKISSNRSYKGVLILSYSSYCMYLFHRPVYIVLKKLYFPAEMAYQVVYLVILCVPCVILVSYILQRTYDNIIGMLKRSPAPGIH